MRILKIMLITFILGGLLAVPWLGCGSGAEEVESKVVTVQRGNLVVDITAVGNLALSRTEDLAIDLFYPEGTIEEVLVEEGDTVEEGQVLAKLDIEEWEEQLSALEGQIIAAERQLAAKERELIQTEISLKNAEIALEEAQDVYEWPDIRAAQINVSNAKSFLAYAQRNLDEATTESDIEYWTDVVDSAEAALEIAEETLDAILTAADVEEVAVKKLQVELAQGRLEDARIAIEDARKEIEDAEEALDEALEASPEIIAPFDGFITMVNVDGGDEVKKGTVAVQLADPDKFEADILVSEIDIFQVKLGGEAWVQVDPMSGISLPAEVTHIAPTATIQSGVVNYKVKVEIQSLEAIMQERQEARQRAMPTILPEDFHLREGLTVTVSIIVDERTDVLLVPNSVITVRGNQAYVQVVSPDGITEERTIKTGISDWQFTEVTDGLSEGEKVVITETATTSTSTTSEPRGRMPFFPKGQ